MAKATTIKVKLVSSADTGFYYVTRKNSRTMRATAYEHSIDWSPDGHEIAFVSNREPNEDQFFNYDLFTLNVATGAIAAAHRH